MLSGEEEALNCTEADTVDILRCHHILLILRADDKYT